MALSPVQDQAVKGKRINKETGELSASGELSLSVELKLDKVEGSQLLRALQEWLQDLDLHTDQSLDHTLDLVALGRREEGLLRVLPLFIQVCESGGRLEGLDIKRFAALTADTVVFKLQRRLADRPAERSREEVVLFFRRPCEDAKNEGEEALGWLLLKSLLLLTADTSEILSCLNPGLPAALVKSLYLLVCLPAKKESVVLEETFREPLTQVLLQLCRLPANVEILVETQELQCLIIGLTSLWDQSCSSWRRQASRVLRAVSAIATSNTVPSLLGKNCVRLCIQNLLQISDVSGSMLAEVAVAVFSFVRDTYRLNPALFVEFDTHDGYKALENILKCCEDGVPLDQFQPVEELLALVASFTLLGKTELKVAVCVTDPQPPGFRFDPPLTKDRTVKNLQAFQLLQASLLRSQDPLLCCQLLQTLQTIWEQDTANFFLLEWTTQSLVQLAPCVWRKPAPVHKRFFSLLELVVFKLNYIPHETLRVVLNVLKQSWAGTLTGGASGTDFGLGALTSFHRMTLHSLMLTEVLSDWGLLELLLGELRRRAKILRKAGVVTPPKINSEHVEDGEKLLTSCMLQLVSSLTLRSIKNTVFLRDVGMVPYVKIFLDEDGYRAPALSILEQLAEINPQEFMSTAVGALCSATQQEFGLKWDLLQSVLKVLENPNSWDAFRTAGGFTGLLSLLTDMEGSLSDRPQGDVWTSLGHRRLVNLLLLALHILALAVHLHTVNAHHFDSEGFYERLAEALLHLGCFHTEGHETEEQGPAESSQTPGKSFQQFVEIAEAPEGPAGPAAPAPPALPVTLRTCIRLLSCFDHFATGTFSSHLNVRLEPEEESDGDPEGLKVSPKSDGVFSESSVIHVHAGPLSSEDKPGCPRAPSSPTSCNEPLYSRSSCDQAILHPGAVRVMMTLLPSIFSPKDPLLSMEVQFSVAHHIQAMVKSERNRQIMCEGGLISTLLGRCRNTLLTPSHPLHLPVTRILEKLSSQAITPSDFRKFLCLGNPLMCLAEKTTKHPESEEVSNDKLPDGESGSSVKTTKRSFSLLQSTASVGSAVPVHQIISLVSMTSPRSFRPHRVSSSPGFVEFDMSESGYGCLFLPSLATVKGVAADSISTGGIGDDCRGFPPSAGLSFACWFQINRFSSACDAHPLRLLSVVRHMSRTEQHYVCLSVSFSAYDGCLVISTEEEAFTYLDLMEPDASSPTALPTALRFSCSSMLVPAQWHHVAVVMAKDVKKSCLVTAYFNGKPVASGKMKYIQPFPGHFVSMDPSAVVDVYGLIGTPALWKEHAALVWRVGPAYLFEESLSPRDVAEIYSQGTAYIGNFLALHGSDSDPDGESVSVKLVPEERICFGLNPSVSTLTTVTQIRDDYNKVDCRLIAKEMGITSRDQATPVFLARNISQHLSGTSRTIGAALMGRFGVRIFNPKTASDAFLYVGGPAVVLSLVAMAPDDGSLYAAVKVLLSVLETSAAMQREMSRIKGYKLLAFLLKMKSNLVSQRTLQLLLYLCSSVEMSCGSGYIQNTAAFEALLCNMEVWQKTSDTLELAVLNNFAEILKSSGDSTNAAVMHSMGLLPKLLFQLCDAAATVQKVKVICCVIESLLKAHFTPLDLRRVGLFLVYTLPPSSSATETSQISDWDLSQDTSGSGPANIIWIRNRMLQTLGGVLDSDSLRTEDQQKAAFDALGSDWFLLFLQPHLHRSTLHLALLLLSRLLHSPGRQGHFRDGVLPGTLVDGVEEPFTVTENLRAESWSYECLSASCRGFDVLQELLIRHCGVPQVYEALAALLLGQRVPHTAEERDGLDGILQSLLDGHEDTQELCVEGATILLELVRIISTRPSSSKASSADASSCELRLSASVMQFFCLLHNRRPRDPLWACPPFLHALAAAVYPLEVSEDVSSLDAGDMFETYPARKPVFDFLRVLVMDSLLNVSPGASAHPLVLLLQFCPDDSSPEQKQRFQTELLELVMNIVHMLSHEEGNNTHLCSHDSSSDQPDGQISTLMDNLVLLCKTLLQALYSGAFLGDASSLLNFLADQIVVTLERGQTQKERIVSALYSCSNQVLLHFLSQPRCSREEKEALISTFQTFVGRWDVVMATYNSNINFITCLLHCLLQIRSGSYPEGFGCATQKVYKGRSSSSQFVTETRGSFSSAAEIITDENLLVSLAETCWSKVLSERQQGLEEAWKMEICVSPAAEPAAVSMAEISPLWEETALKAWQLHTESQKKKISSSTLNKLDVISSALRSALGKQGQESGTVEEFLVCMESLRSRGHGVFQSMRTNHLQIRSAEWERVSSDWLRVEAELLRERAVFGPGPGVMLSRDWVQHSAEGPNRTRAHIRRKALRRSKRVLGSLCLGLRPEACEDRAQRAESDSEPKILCEVGAEAGEDDGDKDQRCDRLTFFPVLNETPAAAEGPLDAAAAEPCSLSTDCHDIRIILQELQPAEEVKGKMCVVMVSGLRVSEGLLLFGKESLLLCEGFTLSPSGDVCCRKHFPSSVRDSFVSTMLSKELPSRCRRWLYDDIKAARFMRFLLEDNAIEIFMKNGHSAFLVFLNKDHVSAYTRLSTVVPALKGKAVAEVIANAKKTPPMEKTALVKWQKGEISNFEYLMHLNTAAGRTSNDLMQYPVFPWVLADYHSEALDLSSPATFRDLSKPMGAQTDRRREQFLQRYQEVESSEGEDLSARCHYCTHYSSAIIVASFLVRMEPFSHTFQTLQGGFDIPERMFYSVKKEWESASRDNMADVRELTPEFFYLPDFLLNANRIPLGCMEDGSALGDVELPPWAKGDPHEFIRVHREALESDFVSSHIHLWIDLIFGFRQRGSAAVESVNTFHPYFYAQRGRQDVKDPVIKSTILGYLSNFGQIPKQLFTKPHPPRCGSRKDGSGQSYPTPFFFNLDKLRTTQQPLKELPRGPVGQILCLEKQVVVLERNRLLVSPPPPPQGVCFSWGFPDYSCAFSHYGTDKPFAVCESLSDWGETLCSVCPNPKTVITGGSSSVVCVWDVKITKDKVACMKLRQPLYGHTAAVTCLAASEVHSVVVSGSRDSTCILWDLEELDYITQLAGHAAGVSAVALNELTAEIVSCAGPLLYLWTMKGQLLAHTDTSPGPRADILCVSFTQRHEWDSRNVIVSGCADGVLRIWRTEYSRIQLPGPPEEPVSPGQDRTHGDVSGWNRRLALCVELRRSKNGPAITALAMSRSHATLLAGDAWGQVFTWTSE